MSRLDPHVFPRLLCLIRTQRREQRWRNIQVWVYGQCFFDLIVCPSYREEIRRATPCR
jgi:hypothetical protein